MILFTQREEILEGWEHLDSGIAGTVAAPPTFSQPHSWFTCICDKQWLRTLALPTPSLFVCLFVLVPWEFA